MTDLLTHATPADAAAPGWIDELDGHLTCVGVTDVTHDVRSFTFQVPGSASLRFLPGQYVTLRLDIDGVPVERCYTISSAPTRPEELTITVKRVPGGPVSNWLHDHLRVGDTVRAVGPFGQFSYAVHPAERYLFLTAGSGITPAMSMLRTLCDTDDPADVVFVHCARTPADIIFRSELDVLAARPGVTVTVLCETDSPDEHWSGHYGRLSLAALLTIAPDILDREILTCGPPAYMAAVRETVGLLGIDPARHHEESFRLGDQDQDRPVAGTRYRVDFRRSGRAVDCDSGTTLLDAASRAGLVLPSSCGEGVCGTCKTRLLSGTVDLRHAGGIRQREIDQGKVLLCCSTPTGDLVLDA